MIAKSRLFDNRGVTLVELLVVIVIISILSAMVLPSFKNVMSERKTNVAALEVKSFLEAARARAIARGKNVSVILERLSSRGDGFGIDPTNRIVSTNPPRSITALNPDGGVIGEFESFAGSNDFTNYTQYNTCIRMTMAETLRPKEYAFAGSFYLENLSVEDGSTTPVPPNYYGDIDGIEENNRIVIVPLPLDPRLLLDCVVGNQIELMQDSDVIGKFEIVGKFFDSANQLNIALNNEGTAQQPFGSIGDIQRLANLQKPIAPFHPIPGRVTGMRVFTAPIVLSSVTNELPRGTCIDLSISGLATDDSSANYTGSEFTNCQREFASDWIMPVSQGGPPTPQQLRPIYITFSSSGNIDSVTCNAPQNSAFNPPTAPRAFNTRRIEPNQDIFLFVGRTDQVIFPLDSVTSELNAAGIAQRADEGAKPNILDPTGYWVRISAVNGSVSAAPAQSHHVELDVNEARANAGPGDDLSEMLTESRALTFQGELSSQ